MQLKQEKPKILIFSLAYFPFIGGAEVAVKEIITRLPEFEFDMITCNLDGQQKAEEQINNIKIYRVGRGKFAKIFFPFLAYKKACSLFCHPDDPPTGGRDPYVVSSLLTGDAMHYRSSQETGANNYIIWSIMANQAGLAALFFKKKFPQVKFLLTLQEGDSVFNIWKKTWYMRPLYKAIYHSADCIQAISNFLAKRALKYGYKRPIEVIPNGVDLEKFKYLEKNLLDKKDKVILTDSRLVEKNGVEYLIKAMILINIKIKLLILADGPLREYLQKLVVNLNLQDRVEFLGLIPYDNIQKYYAEADVFVRPSLTEGFGNVFIQAMAAGIPVIATPVGGIPDFLKAGETGWFCEVKNPQSIAEKINYILDEKNKDEVERVVANAKKMVEEKYTWEIVTKKMKNIFVSLIFNF